MRRSVHSPPYVALRQTLVQGREKAGLTQIELAAKLGRPQSYVAKYETGDRRLDIVELIEVCEAIGIDIAPIVAETRQRLHD